MHLTTFETGFITLVLLAAQAVANPQIVGNEFGPINSNPIGLGVASARMPVIAISPNSAVQVSWEDRRDSLWAIRHRTIDYSVSPPIAGVQSESIRAWGSAESPQLSAPDNTHIGMVWLETNGIEARIYFSSQNQAQPMPSWASPQRVLSLQAPFAFSASAPQIAMSSTGDTYICWSQQEIERTATNKIVSKIAGYLAYSSDFGATWAPTVPIASIGPIHNGVIKEARLSFGANETCIVSFLSNRDEYSSGVLLGDSSHFKPYVRPIKKGLWQQPELSITPIAGTTTQSIAGLRLSSNGTGHFALCCHDTKHIWTSISLTNGATWSDLLVSEGQSHSTLTGGVAPPILAFLYPSVAITDSTAILAYMGTNQPSLFGGSRTFVNRMDLTTSTLTWDSNGVELDAIATINNLAITPNIASNGRRTIVTWRGGSAALPNDPFNWQWGEIRAATTGDYGVSWSRTGNSLNSHAINAGRSNPCSVLQGGRAFVVWNDHRYFSIPPAPPNSHKGAPSVFMTTVDIP